MRISTCKYIHKMNIAKDNNQCSQSHEALELLEHVFIHCPHTTASTNISFFIRGKLGLEFRDKNAPYEVYVITQILSSTIIYKPNSLMVHKD